jgi:hypothetical protein
VKLKKKQKPSYARTTITVPRELKQRMKSVRDYVNWSSVARRAFEATLNELSQQQQADEESATMEGVVARLRRLRSEALEDGGSRSAGDAQGRKWAMNVASPEQLNRLEQFRMSLSEPQWEQLFLTDAGWRELARRIDPATLSPNGRPRPGKERALWKGILEEPPEDLAFFQGFAEGAISVWREVRDQL